MALGITIYNILKERYRHIFFMMMVWLSLTIWGIFSSMTIVYLDLDFSRFRHYFFIPLAFSMSLLLDSLTRESYDPLKLTFVAIFSTALFIYSLDPNMTNYFFFPNGEVTLAATGSYRIAISILTGFTGILYFAYMLRIYLKSPKNLKLYASMILLGGITLGIGGPLVGITGINVIIPGIETFFTAGGALFVSISFVKQPKLAYVLPFKAVKLVVIEIKRGITLFSYNWIEKEETVEDIQFTAMISSVSKFIEEIVQKGGVRELYLEKATLILDTHSDSPVSAVILTNKSNKTLKNALSRFSRDFFQDYSKYFSASIDTEQYKNAYKLVKEHFPFVPEYKD